MQTFDERWLSIDGRVLFKATVAASETYNTALEHHLRDRLEVRFADRPDADPWNRTVREIIGVAPVTQTSAACARTSSAVQSSLKIMTLDFARFVRQTQMVSKWVTSAGVVFDPVSA